MMLVCIPCCCHAVSVRYLVLPMRPEGTEGWSEEQLMSLVTRDSMIGVTPAAAAAAAEAVI